MNTETNRLNAAAPDLLAALQAVLDMEGEAVDNNRYGTTDLERKVFGAARAAIAKAGGRERVKESRTLQDEMTEALEQIETALSNPAAVNREGQRAAALDVARAMLAKIEAQGV